MCLQKLAENGMRESEMKVDWAYLNSSSVFRELICVCENLLSLFAGIGCAVTVTGGSCVKVSILLSTSGDLVEADTNAGLSK